MTRPAHAVRALTRRHMLLVLAAAAGAGAAGCAGSAGSVRSRTDGVRRAVDARGEWWVPSSTGPAPTVVLVHGGYWRPTYDRHLEDAVAADLAARGYLCWNIDYRASDTPWPTTLRDVAAAYDALFTGRYATRVDAGRIAVVGHSAGGHLALWLASRQRLPAGAPSGLAAQAGTPMPRLVVGQAPVAALARAAELGLGSGAAQALCDGDPRQVPGHYAVADPAALVPTGVRSVLVHGVADDVVPISQSEDYRSVASAAGDSCSLVRVPGGHFEHLDPASEACAQLRAALANTLLTPAGGSPRS